MKKIKTFIPFIFAILGSMAITSCGPIGGGQGDATVRVSTVTLSESILNLKVNESQTLVATVMPENATNKDIVWSSNNLDTATVANGLVSGVGVGNAVITATSVDGNKSGSCVVIVTSDDPDPVDPSERVPVTGISLDRTTLDLTVGGSAVLSATISPSNATNKGSSWSSSNPEVASVEYGLVKGLSEGTTTIKVTSTDGGFEATCAVTVQVLPSDPVTLNVVTMADSDEVTTMNNFITNYKKLPGRENVDFKIVKASNYDDYLYNAFLYHDLADIVPVFDYSCEYYTNVAQDKQGNTLLQSLSGYMERDHISEDIFFDSILDITKCKQDSDDMYWVPRDYNKVVCAYNKNIFDYAGLPYPTSGWTWDDFVQTCSDLYSKSAEIKAQTKRSTFFPIDINMNFPAVYYPILKSYGIDLVDKVHNVCFGDVDSTDSSVDKTVQAETVWGKLLSLIDNGYANNSVKSYPFTNNQAAMMFIVRPNLPTYVKGIGEKAIDFVTLPTYTDLPSGKTISYVGMGCTGYGMTTACSEEKKEAAWDFLKYIISEEGQNVFSAIGSGIPCLKALATAEDAVFKQYLVTDDYHPNHDAFVAEPERDIRMDYLHGFKPKLHIEITDFIKNRTLEQFYKAKDRSKYFADFKTNLEKILTK